MRIEDIIWLEVIVDKLAIKHHVEPDEVEEVLLNHPKFYFVENGERHGEDVYMALGQTNAGRYLTVLFIFKQPRQALILSARDMATKEWNRYGK